MTSPFPHSSPKLPELGDLIDGRFALVERLGQGPTGVSYLARHTLLNETYVLKLFAPELQKNEAFMEHLSQATTQRSTMTHSGLVRSFLPGVCAKTGWLYQPSEKARGKNLQELIDQLNHKGKTYPPDDTLQLLQALVSILGDMHRQGAYHNNLKPSNIFIRQEKSSTQVQITDLGHNFPTVQYRQDASSTATDKVYKSPQQHSNPTKGSISDDVYALGVTLHTILMGRPPTLVNHHNTPIVKGLDNEMTKVLQRAFHPREDVRTSSVQNVLHGFRAALQQSRTKPHTPSSTTLEESTLVQVEQQRRQADTPITQGISHSIEDLEAWAQSSAHWNQYQPSTPSLSPPEQTSPQVSRSIAPSDCTPCQGILVLESTIQGVSLHSKGYQLAVNCGTHGISVWDTTNWNQVAQLNLPFHEIRHMGWHPFEENILVLCTTPQCLAFYDIRTQKSLCEFHHQSSVRDWVIDSESQTLYSVTSDRSYYRWDLHTYTLQQTWPITDGLLAHTLALSSSSGYLVASAGRGKLHFTSLQAGKSHHNKRVDGDYIDAICAHPAIPLLYTGHGNGSVQSWDLQSMSLNKMMYGHADRILSIQIAHSSDLVATLSEDQSIRIWSTINNLHLETISLASATKNFSLDPKGHWLLAPQKQSIHIWELSSLLQVRETT